MPEYSRGGNEGTEKASTEKPGLKSRDVTELRAAVAFRVSKGYQCAAAGACRQRFLGDLVRLVAQELQDGLVERVGVVFVHEVPSPGYLSALGIWEQPLELSRQGFAEERSASFSSQ